eukprot:1659955-Rhodomonas_salina.2
MDDTLPMNGTASLRRERGTLGSSSSAACSNPRHRTAGDLAVLGGEQAVGHAVDLGEDVGQEGAQHVVAQVEQLLVQRRRHMRQHLGRQRSLRAPDRTPRQNCSQLSTRTATSVLIPATTTCARPAAPPRTTAAAWHSTRPGRRPLP